MSQTINQGGYPDGCTGPDLDHSWCDDAREILDGQECDIKRGLDGSVFVEDVEAAFDTDDGVIASGTVSLRVRVTGPLDEMADKARNAIASALLLYDMSIHDADASAATILTER